MGYKIYTFFFFFKYVLFSLTFIKETVYCNSFNWSARYALACTAFMNADLKINVTLLKHI